MSKFYFFLIIGIEVRNFKPKSIRDTLLEKVSVTN